MNKLKIERKKEKYYSNGQLKWQIIYRINEENDYREWYETGQIFIEAHFENDQKVVIEQENNDGTIEKVVLWRSCHSLSENFDGFLEDEEKGSLFSKIFIQQQNQRRSRGIIDDQRFILKVTSCFRNLTGHYKQWRNDGFLICDFHYKNGKLNGEVINTKWGVPFSYDYYINDVYFAKFSMQKRKGWIKIQKKLRLIVCRKKIISSVLLNYMYKDLICLTIKYI